MRDREHERTHHEPERRPAEPPRPLHDVLALQRSAGNQAVTAMLARQSVAEEMTGGGAKAAAAGTVKLTKIGVIPILSFSASTSSSGQGQDFTFVSKLGEHSAKLTQAAVSGTAMNGEVDAKGLKLKIENAYVTQYQTSTENEEQWSLSPGSARVDDGSGGGGGGGGGSWDLGGRQPG